MGWAEFERVKNDYNEEFKLVDEEVLKLIHKRKALAKGKHFFPTVEVMEEWAKKFEMETSEISWFINQLNDSRGLFYQPDVPGELLGVLQIMKKSTLDDFDYVLTHSMQYEHASIVTLEINYKHHNDENIGNIIPHLILQVTGSADFTVRKNGARGGGGHTQLQFTVSPRLPDDLSHIDFALIPFAAPMEFPPKEVILNKEIIFNNN
ncbi:hypothetical protein KDN24_04890 [Bacillus sp. Bva_UNVM-123]|uniref:hypothetical protein n=1 Tax=Bacillus sp. Bva_UNVM-123 TaxID=2829798 RepID=UPI00391F61C1